MAEESNRWPENVPGDFYVDEQCIDCDLCRELCPKCFGRQEVGGYSYVKKQPENEEERSLCAKALDDCPVNAIGDDGK
jgi:ferredoxin